MNIKNPCESCKVKCEGCNYGCEKVDDFEKLQDAWVKFIQSILETKLFTKILIPFIERLSSKL